MMGAFMDKNGAEVTLLDSKNIAEFQQWLQQENDPKEVSSGRIQINPELSIDDFLKNPKGEYISLSAEQQHYLAGRLVYSPTYNEEWGKQLMDQASRYPILLENAYMLSGDTRGGILYEQIHNELKKRNFEDNIPTFHAILTQGGYIRTDLGKGKIRELSPSNRSKLHDIFYLSTKNKTEANNAKYFMSEIACEKLLNFENASPEMREFINKQIFSDSYKLGARLEEMDEKFYTKEIFEKLFERHGIRHPQSSNHTFHPKTQKEKNEGILPTNYLKLKTALVRLAEREEIHDRNNYGKEKSLTQRYKEMVAKLCHAEDYQSIPDNTREGLLNDVYLYTAQKDVTEGRAESLEKQDLEMVLAKDQNNYYTRQLKDMLKNHPELPLNNTQTVIVHTEHDRNFEYIASNSKLGYDEKMTALESKEQMFDNEQSRRKTQQNEKIISAYKENGERISVLNKEENRDSFLAKSIEEIQEDYKGIIGTFKKGVANPQEEYLQKDNLENLLKDFMEGNIEQIPLPEYKSLPLLFGRKDEIARRQMMAVRINKLNQRLRDNNSISSRNYNMSFAELSKEYTGKLLDEETLQASRQKHQETVGKRATLLQGSFRETNTYERAVMEERRKEDNLSKVKEVRAEVERRHQKLAEMAKENISTEPSNLQAVTTRDADEKRAVRAKNKKEVRDPLQDKAEKLEGKNDSEKYAMLKNSKQARLRE